MLRVQICESKTDIRQFLKENLKELVDDMQEVRLTLSSRPFVGILRGYEAAHGDCGRENVLAFCVEESEMALDIADIERLEVLPSRRMCPSHAYTQMRQMEKIIARSPD